MVIRNLFGADSKYLTDLGRIAFSPSVYPTTEEYRNSSWASGSRNLKNLIRTMQEELTLFGNPSSKRTSVSKLEINKSIFVVHGHDEAMKVSVARTLERLGLAAVILHEKPNQGRTIIEKFGDYSDVGFAVVLLSPDDVGKLRAGPTERLGPRARQNVIFELGFFVGRLGRERVIALYRSADNFELPSDYSGILFVVFDESNRWQFDLVKELKAADYDVDANKLLDHE
ncbi:MAG TPA: nucleotide-binding protein [Pyrinomonadaceae bacterium]|jgi:predicted nucleotide-binding protein|nr:nucleotide-binding protein [Pyrinomonadaceae bacterium]